MSPPGPVSDSYDPEFSTAANRQDIIESLRRGVARLTNRLGSSVHNIVSIAQNPEQYSTHHSITFTEQELRILRFALLRTIKELES